MSTAVYVWVEGCQGVVGRPRRLSWGRGSKVAIHNGMVTVKGGGCNSIREKPKFHFSHPEKIF